MPFDLESNTSSLASMLEIDMPSNHVEISTSKMVAITYDQVTWTLRVSQDQEILLRPALGTFPSWLSQQLTVGNSLTDISKPFTIALAFLDLLLELGVEQNILVPVLHNFEEDFLVDRDIHELVLTLPASASTRALERYFAASNMSTHTSPLSKSALLEAAAAGETNICAVFGGQGPSNSACLQDLRDINRIYGMHVDRLVSMTAQTIKQLVVLSETFHYYEYQGFDIERWLQDYSSTPDPAYIASAPVSFPLVGLLGLCHYCIACKITGRHPGEMGKLLCGVTGHSQGVIIAAVIARSSSWADYYEFAQEAIKLLFWIGFESHHESPTSCLSDAAINDCVEAGEGRPTPMLKILGLDRCAVSKLVDDVNTHLTASEHIHLALVNSRDNMVVAGPTRSLRGLNLRLRRIKAGGNLDQSRVPFSERKPVVRSQFLPISGAFHSPALRNVAARILRRFPSMTLCGSDLNIPLYHTGTGEDLKERGLQDILHLMVQMVTTEPVDWPRAISFPRVSYIVDFGPGRTGYLIQEMIQGSGVHVIVASDLVSLSNQVGPKAELFAHTLPAAGPNWQQEYRPKLVKKASGEIVLDTKISRLFGCPPLMVAGMTPTTVPWEFVAAVMKAGYHVELAGGGYVYAADFERAIQRTSQETVTGCSITCNLIYASPKSMGWQIPLIRQMIRKGYPIDGLTIGAGVPSAEVAKEYIETIGLKHISFKPGSYNTILAVIEIAKSHPYFPIGLQWTGGRGGGHHSFEDFHEPILKAYGKIRECANIVLIAGSGFGSANDTYLYITGDWSRARGYPSMPFDGVLLGSRMMVAKEAFTSPQAKELIIQATGVPDSRWHETYQRPAGGVITIQSEMGQPIHMLATRGVMLWHELDRTIFCIRDQAKRVGELQSRKAEIIDRLNKDYQRPWFAVNSRAESVDIEDLTYVELLQRLISLVYVQHQQRWIDVSYKKLILDFAVRARDRLRSSPQAISNLKDPYHFLSEFTLACPSAADELVHVEDASFFIGLCKRSGQKPVNFIPRLDENFEHWFKKDSLWQAEDVDAVIDADAQRTCIIQGPVAAYHSRVVDESAQSILDGIAKPHVEMVRRDFYFDKSIPSVNTNANAAVPLAKYVVLAKQLQGVSVQQTASRIQYEFSSFGELVNDTTFAAHLEQLLSGWAKACVVDATISQGKTRRKNFISALFAPRYDHVVSIDYKDDKTVASLSVSTKDPLSRIRNVIVRLNSFDGRRILMTFSSPSRFKKENVILRFEYDYLPDKPWCRIYEDMRWRNKRIKSFYAQLWLGDYSSSLRYATLQDEFQGNTTTITQSMIQEFSRVVSSSEGTQNMTAFADGVVPLDFSIVLSWEALVKPLLILDIDGDLLQLLHVSNKFDYCSSASPLCIEDTVETTSRIMAVTIQPSGKLVEVVATISRHGEAVLEVNSVFLFQGSFSDYEGTFRRSKESSFEVDVDSERKRALLLSRSWLLMDDLNCDLLGKNLLFRLEIETTYRQYNVMKGLRVTGQVYVCESNATSTSIGQIEFEAESCHGNPVLDFLNRYSSQPDKTTPLQNPGWEGPSSWKIRTPRLNSPYARVSKDTNPIHVSHVFVSYAQLPGTVTHGMFTSAAVRRLVENAAAEADYTRFKRWATTFEGMVLPGDELKVEMQHLAMAEGRLVLKVQAYNHITGNRVLDAEAVVEQAPTAYVFTGQGSQKKGMGMSLYDSSPAARSVWDRSDKHLRDLYGFSIIDIVKKNPKSMTVYFGGKRGKKIRSNYLALKTQSPDLQDQSAEACVIAGMDHDSGSYAFHHERGLLESTQFAQPALTIMEIAAFEDMKSKGLVQRDTLFAGHSLGEYSALGAVAEFLPLESLLSLVFYRGLAMQVAMKRDGHGRTDFSMMAVNPSRIRKDFDEAAFEQLVALVSKETQTLLEVVNYNIEGQQYVCAGHLRALWVLTEVCNQLHRGSSSDRVLPLIREAILGCPEISANIEIQRSVATIPLRGIDVPFHSTSLRGGIGSYRKVLEEKIVEGSIDPERLVDKWIPNVTGTPFAVDRSYVEQVRDVTKSKVLDVLLQNMRCPCTTA